MASHSVGIGELKISGDPADVLTALGLGSCVGVLVFEAGAGLAGLAHCMLPTLRAGREEQEDKPALYVDTGLPRLVEVLLAAGARRSALRAALVGGAAMFEFAGPSLLDVGKFNIESATAGAQQLGLRVVATDLGGKRGRTATLVVADGCVTVRTEGAEAELCRLGTPAWRKAA